jgi:hypothetical protein
LPDGWFWSPFVNTSSKRGAAHVATVVAVVVASVVPLSPGRASDDAGIGAFFREQFGIGEPAPAQEPAYSLPEDRPIIVRPRRRHVVAHRPEAKIVVGPVAPVSIYDDRTLKAGDAVMTAKGVRVFLGGHGAPYTEADFVALADAEGVPKQVEKALLVIDRAPRT